MVLISPEVVQIFQNYYWPGNVRELSNILERILYTIDGDTILPTAPSHLPPEHGQGIPQIRRNSA